MGCAYLLTFPSGKFYVGITSGPLERRSRMHVNSANTGSSLLVHRAIRKYGPPNVRMLIRGDINYLSELEPRLIEAYGTLVPGGYNLDEGGRYRAGLSDVERKAASDRWKDPEYRKKIIEATHTPEANARRSEAMKKVWQRPGYREAVAEKISKGNKGKKKSAEHCKAMSEAQRRRRKRDGVSDRSRELGRINARKRWDKRKEQD